VLPWISWTWVWVEMVMSFRQIPPCFWLFPVYVPRQEDAPERSAKRKRAEEGEFVRKS
jgi:hypothetical protein